MKIIKNVLVLSFLLFLATPLLDAQVVVTPDEKKKKEEQMMKEAEIKLLEAQKKAEMKQKEAELHYIDQKALQEKMEQYRTSGYVYGTYAGFGQSSELSLSKHFNGESAESEKTFEVQADNKRVSVSISGEVKSGEIEIKIVKPNGKSFNAVKIDNSSDVRWRQSLSVGEENKDFVGTWKIIIKATKAEGIYSFRFTAE